MIPVYRALAIVGSLLGASAVIGGALGAHMLKSALAPNLYETYVTAMTYLLPHAVAVVLLANLAEPLGAARLYQWALLAMALGTLLFCGGLVGWVLTAEDGWRRLAPCGGLLLIGAWLMLAVAMANIKGGERR